MDEIVFLAKFPFLESAKELFKEKYSEESLPSSAIISAKNRILEYLAKGMSAELPKIGGEYDAMLEIATFYSERILISALGNSFITNKIAVSEAKCYYSQRFEELNDKELLKLALGLGIRLLQHENQGEERFKMGISSYLNFAPDSIHYKLFYKKFADGFVFLSEHEAKRVMQEAIKKRLESIIYMKESSVQNADVKKALGELRSAIPKFSVPKIKVDVSLESKAHPPCIAKMLSRLYAHENLSHYERWSLAVYFLQLGLDEEAIVQLYQNLPDFSEKITKYQVSHMAKKQYSMPSCEKMRGYGLCVYPCAGIKNPLDWWKNYAGKRKDMGKK